MLQTAIEAAQRAGRLIAERYPMEREITVKEHGELVTEVDVAAEDLILGLIGERFPDHGILSEEAGGDEIGDGYTWLVDPLDGTTNFIHRHPILAVSIGVMERGEPVVGVVHDPLRDHTFVAERGRGASLNGEAVGTSRVADLGHALLGMDWAHGDEACRRLLDHLRRIVARCRKLRISGSAALALTYVAAGWLDGYFHLELKPWDTAAGTLIIAEAGGRCSGPDGSPYVVSAQGLLATNGLIHDELLALLRASTPDGEPPECRK